MKKIMTKEEALLAMASLCARSEQCADDIYKKLRSKGLSHQDVVDVIDKLRGGNFIDDFRFARSFARDKVRFSAWGKRKIRLSLMAKRIASNVISSALDEVEQEDYISALKRCAVAKAKSLDLSLRDDKMKLYRHLLSRGFESSLAVEEVKRLAGS